MSGMVWDEGLTLCVHYTSIQYHVVYVRFEFVCV